MFICLLRCWKKTLSNIEPALCNLFTAATVKCENEISFFSSSTEVIDSERGPQHNLVWLCCGSASFGFVVQTLLISNPIKTKGGVFQETNLKHSRGLSTNRSRAFGTTASIHLFTDPKNTRKNPSFSYYYSFSKSSAVQSKCSANEAGGGLTLLSYR